MTLPETSARGNYKNLEQDNKIMDQMDLGRNSWFTAKHEATISGPYPHHVYFTGNTWLFFCTASAAVKVNQSGDISYQNLKVGKICLQCEAPR